MILKAEESLLNLNDLYNYRAKARKIFLYGRTLIEAVIEGLSRWITHYELDSV